MAKGRRSASKQQQVETKDVEGDCFEDEYEPRGRRDLDDVGDAEPDFVEDDEISSSEDEELEGMPMRYARASTSESEGEQSFGSSVDEADLADLSHMLSDDEGDVEQRVYV